MGSRTRPLAHVGLLLLLLALVQIGRLTLFMVDRAQVWGAAALGVDRDHECLAAYVRAGELAGTQPSALYDPAQYARRTNGDGSRVLPTRIAGLGEALGDPFMYPPPFLVLAALLARAPTMAVARVTFYALHLVVAVTLMWTLVQGAGRERRNVDVSLAVVAGFFASLPVLLDLQFGQIHLLLLLVALSGMLAVQQGRPRFGAALLAAATVVKIFPAILLVVLAAERRFRALAWTAGFVTMYAALALGLYGGAPFAAFVDAQLGGLVTGDAFSRFRGSHRFALQDLGAGGIWEKVAILTGAGDLRWPASLLRYGCAAVTLILAVAVGRRRGSAPAVRNAGDVGVWAALLGLGAMTAGYLPVEYGMAGVLLVLALTVRATFNFSPVRTMVVVAIWLTLQAAPLFRHLPMISSVPYLAAALGVVVQVAALVLLLRTTGRGLLPAQASVT